MTKTLDTLLSIWHYWFFLSFGIAIIGFFIVFYVFWWGTSKNGVKKLIISAILLGQFALSIFLASEISDSIKSRARKEIISFLKEKDVSVLIDGNPMGSVNSKSVVIDFIDLKDYTYSRSHPIDTFVIVFNSSTDTIRLRVARDSELVTDYWVFWDKYDATKSNELGHVRSKKLKDLIGG